MAGASDLPRNRRYPGNSNCFPNFYSGAGGNAAPVEEGLGVAASLAGDSTWQLRFQLPESIPSGTAKLRLRALANATRRSNAEALRSMTP